MRLHDPSELSFGKESSQCVQDMNWAELHETLPLSVGMLFDLVDNLSFHAIKEAFAQKFKTKTEQTLVQANLVHRMKDGQLHLSLQRYLLEHQIKHQFHPAMDFVLNVLGIEESRYKWLKRLGENIPYLRKLAGSVKFTSEGFLEKLSYLGTAIRKHPNNFELIIHALNYSSAKRFRVFARNSQDDLSSDPITLKSYLKAKPYIEKLRAYQLEGKPVTVIYLKSERDLELLDNINLAMEPGREYLQSRYPGIIWDSSSKADNVSKTIPESGENEQETVAPADNISVIDFQPNIDNSIVEDKAA